MWFKKCFKSRTSTSSPHRQLSRARLYLEPLEDRSVPSYSITYLGMGVADINASGQIVGRAGDGQGNVHAYLWQNGAKTDLGTLGGDYSEPFGMNDAGQVVGMSYTSAGALRAFLLTPEDTDGNGTPDRWFRDSNGDGGNDLMRDLGTLGGNDALSLARDVNNLGQVVGQSSNGRAFLWQNGVSSDLGAGIARAINDAGLITGSFVTSGSSHAFLWKNGTMTDLGGSNGGNDINGAGQLVADGRLWTPTVPNGTTGTFTYLDPLPPLFPEWGVGSGYAFGINNAGHVVGYTLEGEAEWGSELYRATLWADGVIEELPLGIAVAINDAGQIVGENYLLTPNDLPPVGPTLTITDVTITEGHSGTRDALFTVILSAASTETVSVAFAAANGSATAGSDYQANSGTLTFAPGETRKTITVLLYGDRIGEPNETFFLNLSNPTNATIADGQGAGTILDDEPRISISDVTKREGRKNTTSFVFTVTLSAAYDQPVTMSYRSVDGTATTSDSDYIAKTGTLTFAPGETTKIITIEVKGDSKRESNEAFYLELFGASSNSLLVDALGLATILNDD